MVCVKSEQRSVDGEKQVMQTKCEGRLSEREGVLYVLYTENVEESGTGTSEKVKNLLKIENRPVRVKLKKTGAVCWEMSFEQGKTGRAEYVTPYGALEIGVETKDVKLEKGQKKTSLQLMYVLFIQDEKQADCRLEIEVV